MSDWKHFQEFFLHHPELDMSLDLSRMNLTSDFLASMQPRCEAALADMKELEGGAVANPDEKRQVGHYWLRAPRIAPTPELRAEIETTLDYIEDFARRVHSGEVAPPTQRRFTRLLSIGIGGSALGPQFLAAALGSGDDKMEVVFLDNTDPAGFDALFEKLGADLASTLTVVISKSGGTPETLNGMLETAEAYRKVGLTFAQHAVAITGNGSVLDKQADKEHWLARFPMWDWVGGRTSVMSAVGLLPLALQGVDIRSFLRGAQLMDVWTRDGATWQANPALALALAWYRAGDGQGKKDMVVLPYKDRLALFSRYLQQLVMESLGKAQDLDGKTVHQGIAVYGNKGSTDQHAYVQQLRDGLNNFFATFVVVLHDRDGSSIPVAPDATSGDFLNGFWMGTRQALSEGDRSNAVVTLPQVTPLHVGALIALYERTVSFYASFVHINAYHQPGVEAGKKAAASILKLQGEFVGGLTSEWLGVSALADKLGADAETVFLLMRHLGANPRDGIQARGQGLQLELRRG